MITAKDRFRFGCYWLCMGIFAAACDKEGSHHQALHKTVPSVHRSDTQQTQKKTLPKPKLHSFHSLQHKPPTPQPTDSQPNRRDPITKPTPRKHSDTLLGFFRPRRGSRRNSTLTSSTNQIIHHHRNGPHTVHFPNPTLPHTGRRGSPQFASDRHISSHV